MNKSIIETNKRSLEDQAAQGYLTKIRSYQRRAEDAWTEVLLNELKLRDYLNNRPIKSDLEYLKQEEKFREILEENE